MWDVAIVPGDACALAPRLLRSPNAHTLRVLSLRRASDTRGVDLFKYAELFGLARVCLFVSHLWLFFLTASFFFF